MQFHVPLPNRMAVDTVPNIYHLVELKDNYQSQTLRALGGIGCLLRYREEYAP